MARKEDRENKQTEIELTKAKEKEYEGLYEDLQENRAKKLYKLANTSKWQL